jgi:hypothetical protein
MVTAGTTRLLAASKKKKGVLTDLSAKFSEVEEE